MVDADVCVFACTGRQGTAVTRWIVELASTDYCSSRLTILLAGRNVAKVRELRAKLLADENNNEKNVNIVVHLEAVDMNDEDALHTMVARARVVANCIDVDCHPRALLGVAEACAKAGVDYLDLAPRRGQLESLFDAHLNNEAVISKARIVPACGFDFAFFDIPVFHAEKTFAQLHNSTPDKVQLTLALRTGPLGMKWPLRLAKQYLESESSSKPRVRTVAADASHQMPSTSTPRKSSKSRGSILAYSKPLSACSIPWPLGGDAISFLFCQRGDYSPGSVDARIALPRKLWKAAALALYGVAAAAILLPLMSAARYFKIRAFQRLLLWVLPTVTLGFLSNDDELCQKSIEQMRIELVVTLRNSSEGRSICYHVMGPSPDILNPLCMALSSLELAKDTSKKGGVSTPAMAMGESDFWSRLQNTCDIKVQISAA